MTFFNYVYVCVCVHMYVHVPTEARRGHLDPLELQIQVFVSSQVWVQGPELGSLQRQQVISTADPSLQPHFLGILVLSSHPGWPWGQRLPSKVFSPVHSFLSK